MKDHIMSVHLKKKDNKCEECGKEFSQKGNLGIHIKNVHRKVKPFECPQLEMERLQMATKFAFL